MNILETLPRMLAGPARAILARQFRRRYEPLLQQSHDHYEARQDLTWRPVDDQFAVAIKTGGIHSRERLPQPSLHVRNLRADAQFRVVVVTVHVVNRDGSQGTERREHRDVQQLRHPMVDYELSLAVPVVATFDYCLEIEWFDGVTRSYRSPSLRPLHSDVLDPPMYRMYDQMWHTRALDNAFRSFHDQLCWAALPDVFRPRGVTYLNNDWRARALRTVLQSGLGGARGEKGLFWVLLLTGRATINAEENFCSPHLDRLIGFLKPGG